MTEKVFSSRDWEALADSLSTEVDVLYEENGEDIFDFRVNLRTDCFNKKGYYAFYKKADKLKVELRHVSIYFFYDVSSYEYWRDNGDGNYLFLTVAPKEGINSQEINPSTLELTMHNMLDELSRYWDFLYSRDHYTRKSKI